MQGPHQYQVRELIFHTFNPSRFGIFPVPRHYCKLHGCGFPVHLFLHHSIPPHSQSPSGYTYMYTCCTMYLCYEGGIIIIFLKHN
uniref:Uncharacterized protein n=1 Tax=Amphimedon queenslandica TaxID=400682 RepID=A0A1X7TX96_AMPQE